MRRKNHFPQNCITVLLILSIVIVLPVLGGNSNNIIIESYNNNLALIQNPTQGLITKKILEKNVMVNSHQTIHHYEKRYAVIIVGYYNDSEHYKWFTIDAQRQYDVLRNKYNFSDNDIYVLATQKKEWIDNLSMDPAIIDYNATRTNIKMVFTSLASIITENDLLYVVVINHGADTHHFFFTRLGIDIDFWQGIFAHDTYFALEKTENNSRKAIIQKNDFGKILHQNKIGERIYDYELNEYIQDIHARRIILVLQPCFSGGFINDLSNSNHVVITASTEAQQANAPFIGYFYFGLNGSANDTNQDGRISLKEIYEYSADIVYDWIKQNPEGNGGRFQYPLIDDNGDKIGHRYRGLFGYNPDIPTKDGYIAARIYNLSYEEL